jgi:hypothetical protein
LFCGNSWISYVIEYMSGSRYSHAGILICNPREIGIDVEDGDYVLHSGYGESAETGQMIYGVHLERLDKVLAQYTAGSVFIRVVHAPRDKVFYERLKKIHEDVHSRPYDMNLFDWLAAWYYGRYYEIPGWYRNTSRFWCSALVSYVYDRLGWLYDVDWTIVSPGELAESGRCLKWRVPVESAKRFF